MTCKECKWWNRQLEMYDQPPVVMKTCKEGESETVLLGRCQRHAPLTQFFASTREDDWCGDFEPLTVESKDHGKQKEYVTKTCWR